MHDRSTASGGEDEQHPYAQPALRKKPWRWWMRFPRSVVNAVDRGFVLTVYSWIASALASIVVNFGKPEAGNVDHEQKSY